MFVFSLDVSAVCSECGRIVLTVWGEAGTLKWHLPSQIWKQITSERRDGSVTVSHQKGFRGENLTLANNRRKFKVASRFIKGAVCSLGGRKKSIKSWRVFMKLNEQTVHRGRHNFPSSYWPDHLGAVAVFHVPNSVLGTWWFIFISFSEPHSAPSDFSTSLQWNASQTIHEPSKTSTCEPIFQSTCSIYSLSFISFSVLTHTHDTRPVWAFRGTVVNTVMPPCGSSRQPTQFPLHSQTTRAVLYTKWISIRNVLFVSSVLFCIYSIRDYTCCSLHNRL